MQKEFIVLVKMSGTNKLSTGILPALKTKSERPNGFNLIILSALNHSKIIFYETRKSKRQAIVRENELKKLNRKKLTDLVKSVNPEMLDVSAIWAEDNIFFDKNSNFQI
jgi:predicted GIY-YIG superfamily endonuclease